MLTLEQLMRAAVEALDGQDVQLREKYSGRGMYGRECPGITGDFSDCMAVIGEAIKVAANAGVDFPMVVDTLLGFKQDSMGRDVIVYWPQLEAFEYEDEPERSDGQPDEAQEWHDFDPDC